MSSVFRSLAVGIFPPTDGLTEHLGPPPGARAAVLAFTAHNVIAAALDPEWVRLECPEGDLVAPVRVQFLHELANRINGSPGPMDLVLVANSVVGDPGIELVRADECVQHPRIQRAWRVRREVRAYATPNQEAIIVVGKGLAGRWEAGFEVESNNRNQGVGRAVASAARGLIPPGETLFLQVAAGNVASLRAVLAAGFMPVGAEILFNPGENLDSEF